MWKSASRLFAREAWWWMLAAMGLCVLLVAVTRAKSEGWAFLDDARELPFNEQDAKKHFDLIRKYCSRGMSIEAIMQEKPEWSWLAKYSETDMRRACYSARTNQLSQTVLDLPESTALNAQCRNGRKACPRADLKRERPCMNRDETKCCHADGKDCLEIDHATGLDAPWIARVKQEIQKARDAGCGDSTNKACLKITSVGTPAKMALWTDPYAGTGRIQCFFTKKVPMTNGGIACPSAYGYQFITGVDSKTMQCAMNSTCTTALQEYYRTRKAPPALSS